MSSHSIKELVLDGNVLDAHDEVLSSLLSYLHLEKLTAHHLGLENCMVLAPLTKLKALDLSFNVLTKIDGLASITGLHTLLVAHNNLQDLATLPYLPLVEVLSLSDNPLHSIEGIVRLPALRILYLRKTQLQGLESLEKLKVLESLFVSISKWSQLMPLERHATLTKLHIQSKTIKGLCGMPILPSLQELTVTQSQALTVIDAVDQLEPLTRLTLSYNAIEDFSFCYELPNLQYLDVRGNPGAKRMMRERLVHVPVVRV